MFRRLFVALLVSAFVAIAVVGSSGATDGNLPGGTSISVSITAPANNAVLPLGPFTLNGTASVGRGAAIANTTLIYVVDVSGSTSAPTGHTGKCPRQNVYDLSADTTLDCELLAIRDLNNAAILTGTVSQIGMIGFANTDTDTLSPLVITSAAALDLSPLGGVTTLTAPGANDFHPGWTPGPFTPATNLDWVVQSAYLSGTPPSLFGWPAKGAVDGFTLFGAHDFGGGTNYTAALYALKTLLLSVPPTQNVVVAFMSDGFPNATVGGQALATVLGTLPTTNLTVDTFAVGTGTCGTNPPGSIAGSLEQISAHFGKHCQPLTDASDAVNLVPGVVASHLNSISISTDGGPVVPPTTTSLPLPQTGPADVTFTRALTPGAGTHHICATANGADGGGNGSVQDCTTVTLIAAPVVTIPSASGNEGADIPVTGTVTSASPNPLSYLWSALPASGVDAGATCTFADATVLSTTVSCTDNGTYTLELTVDDGANAPVTRTSTLTVANVPPTVTITAPTPGTYPAATVFTVDAPITDAGSNDTQTCTIDWNDGTTEPGAIVGGSCQGTHHYVGISSPTITVDVTDDNGGVGQALVSVTIDQAPFVHVFSTAGDEGSAIPLNGDVADDGPDTQFWTYAPGPGVDPGATCAFGDATAPSTTVTCTDDGTYDLTLTASDGINPPVSDTGTLTVSNVAPSVSIASPAPGTYAQGAPITLNAPILDPGTNDAPGCSINWGDGTPESGVVAGGGCQGSHTYTTGGVHTITVTADDTDGGTGSASTTITSDAPPSVSVGNASGNEGASIPILTTVNDNGPLSLSWSYAPVSGVDIGATCSFSGNNVKCTDDGVYSITLTVDDHVNPPVSASGTLTVANVPPTVSIATPAAGSYAGTAAITLNAPFTDPGSNDSQTCTVDWGDGTVEPGTIASGSCQGTHTYSGGASHVIKVTVTDDNGGSGSASVTVTSNQPPVVTVPAASSGNEGAAIPVVGTVADDGVDTLAWTYAAVSGTDPGATCTFANPAAASTTVKCTDDGVYKLTLTADDHVNPPVSASGTLTVSNVAPKVTITKPTANALVQSSTSVVLHAPFTDPGANDTQTCSVDWGDGSTATGTVAGNACDATHSYSSGGPQTITVTVTDDDGGSGTATVKIKVNQPPDCTHATASPSVLWPPDHEFVLITVSGVTDPNGDPIDLDITGVTQDEALNGRGDGDTEHDALWAWRDWQVWVRAERSDYGNGRVYRISFKASDGKGGSCTGVVKVGVPHDRHGTAIDNPSVSVDSFGHYDDHDRHHRH